jgi:hypothetical protein
MYINCSWRNILTKNKLKKYAVFTIMKYFIKSFFILSNKIMLFFPYHLVIYEDYYYYYYFVLHLLQIITLNIYCLSITITYL